MTSASDPPAPRGFNPGLGAIRLVAFDLDGTLIDSIGDIATSVNEALLETYGDGVRLPQQTVRGFVGGGARQLVERCLASLERPAPDAGPVFERFLAIYSSRCIETTRLYDGMAEVMDVIERSAKLAILTNKPGFLSRTIVKELGLEGRFISVVGGDDFKTKKPDPEGLLFLGARAGVRPEEVALVGDSAVDIKTARNARAVAIGVRWGYDNEAMEREIPDRMVESPAELARLFLAQ